MYLFHVLRSFLPLRNPIGFGASDFIVFATALLLTILLLAKAYLAPLLYRLAAKPHMLFPLLFILPIGLRLMLLLRSPVPIPSGADDFSYLLLSDTLSHGRLANSTHPMHSFFETVFVLQQPTYASIYPIGQGLVLAAGQLLFRCPWAGILISGGALSMLCCWMLRAWVAPIYSLWGGMLAALQFGALCSWMNSYWGGFVSACAGCLVFGSMPRLTAKPSVKYGILLGIGIACELLTRPFETIVLLIAVILYFVLHYREIGHRVIRPICITAGIILAAFGLTLAQNKAVTRSWFTLPYVLSRFDYGVPATFTFQQNAVPHVPLTAEQELDYRAQAAIHGQNTDTLGSYLNRLSYRVRYLPFFLLPPMYFAVVALFTNPKILIYPACVIALFALGTNFYPYFFPHYVAAITPVLILLGIQGMMSIRRSVRQYLPVICIAYLSFWFLVFSSGDNELMRVTSLQSWSYLNPSNPQGRAIISAQLAHFPGEHLVFVRYGSSHRFAEWIHNRADIDASTTVWANDLGTAENRRLIGYYPARKVWLMEPDLHPPKLSVYPDQADSFLNIQ